MLSQSVVNEQRAPLHSVVDDSKAFGAYVRSVRLRAGKPSQDIAEQLGVCAPHYVRIELGRKGPPVPEKWAPFCELGADRTVLQALYDRYYAARGGQRSNRVCQSAKRDLPAGHPLSLSWAELEWDDDDWCWYAVAHHPEGLSQDQISMLTGLAPGTIEAIELSALRKLSKVPEAREAFESMLLLRQCQERASHFEISPRW